MSEREKAANGRVDRCGKRRGEAICTCGWPDLSCTFGPEGSSLARWDHAKWLQGRLGEARSQLARLRDAVLLDLTDADDQLREYVAERAHGATANPEYLDRCAAAARFHTTRALAALKEADRG